MPSEIWRAQNLAVREVQANELSRTPRNREEMLYVLFLSECRS